MPKMRLNILDIGFREILMKDIISVVIDGVEYRKSHYMDENDSKIIQGFYNFVKKFKEKITYICYKHHGSKDYLCFIYLEDGKLHSLSDYAICDVMLGSDFKQGAYFVNGKRLDFPEWQKKVRKIKLERLSEK